MARPWWRTNVCRWASAVVPEEAGTSEAAEARCDESNDGDSSSYETVVMDGTEFAPLLKINGIQVPVTLAMAEPEARRRARWLASEKRREMQQEMIGMYMFGKDHPRMGQTYENRVDPFSTTAALMAKYGQSEAGASVLLAAVEDRWDEFGMGELEQGPPKRRKLANTPVTPTVAPTPIPRAGCVVS